MSENINRVVLTLVGFYCVSVGAVTAQEEATVSITASAQSIQIAQELDVEIVVTADKDAVVEFPILSSRLGPFEIITQSDTTGIPMPTASVSRNYQWTKKLTLETLETGSLEIPPIEVLVSQKKRTPIRLTSQAVSIEVVSSIDSQTDPLKFKPIHSVIDVTEPAVASYRWILWCAIGLTTFSTLLAAGWYLVGRQPWTTPAQWATVKVNQIRASKNTAMTELDQILRAFVEKEYGFPATTYPIQQLVETLKDYEITEETAEKLNAFLQEADQAKFAGLSLSNTDVAEKKSVVLNLIDRLDKTPGEST